jgi:hypothetical protein
MTDHKKPSLAFSATVAVGVVVTLYVLSFGPACWLADRGLLSMSRVSRWYRPLVRAAAYDWPIAGPALNWYGNLLALPTRFWTALSRMGELVILDDSVDELNVTGRISRPDRRAPR